MSWCCMVPVRLAYPNDEKLFKSAQVFGQNLGVAFQMVDDVIDFEPHGEKDFAKDVKEGLINFVMAELLRQNPHLTEAVSCCLGQPAFQNPWSASELESAVKTVREKSASYLKIAEEEFQFIKSYSDPGDPGVLESVGAVETLMEFLKFRHS